MTVMLMPVPVRKMMIRVMLVGAIMVVVMPMVMRVIVIRMRLRLVGAAFRLERRLDPRRLDAERLQ